MASSSLAFRELNSKSVDITFKRLSSSPSVVEDIFCQLENPPWDRDSGASLFTLPMDCMSGPPAFDTFCPLVVPSSGRLSGLFPFAPAGRPQGSCSSVDAIVSMLWDNEGAGRGKAMKGKVLLHSVMYWRVTFTYRSFLEGGTNIFTTDRA